MNLFLVFLFSFCATVFTSGDVKSYRGYKEFQVKGDKKGLDSLEESVKDFQDRILVKRYSASTLQALVAPELIAIFEEIVKAQKLQAKLVFDDVSKIIQLEKEHALRGKGFSWSAYYDIDDIYGYVQNMSAAYPEWTQLVVAGESYEGRQIKGLRINTPEGRAEGKPAVFIESELGTQSYWQQTYIKELSNFEDNGDPGDVWFGEDSAYRVVDWLCRNVNDKNTAVIDLGIHAREWITPATTTYFINQLLTSDNPDIVALRNQFDWHIFPSVNPDGYHFSYTKDRMWRKTRSKSANGCYGADPNRNWDYNWLKHGANNNPCDYQVYGGSKPFSEIETKSLSEYISGIENLLGYIAFHADAQMLLVPYSDSEEHTDNYDDLITIGKNSLNYGYKVNGAKYDGPATAAEVLYKASGGSMDWVRYALGTQLVYTYELRGYYFYWPPALIYQQGDEVTRMMLGLFKEAGNLGYYK